MPKPRAAAPAANPDAFLAQPEHVPGYRDLVQIGYGGFSVVYRAVQESVDRAVALKVLTVAGPDADTQRRFDREVRLAGRLSGHPHVVTVLDTGTTASGRPFLAMDLYDGGSMKEWLGRRGPLTPAQAAGVGAKIAEALAAAHELGVLHRDVKPNNILVSRYGEPALADFGVSCLLDSSASGSVLDIFSPQHAAPELMTRGVPSVASDVYALASSLYELLTGRPPFHGNGQDVRATMFRTVSEPAPRADCPGLPGLADAIERAMAKEPHDRFPDAAGFARELRALIPDGESAALVMGDGAEPTPEAVRASASFGGHPAVVGPAAVGAAAVSTAAVGAAAIRPVAVRPVGDLSHAADMTDEMYVYSASEHYPSRPDDTMVRPDREDRAAGAERPGRPGRPDRDGRGAVAGGRPGSGRGGDRGDGRDEGRGDRGARGGESRSRKPLLVVAGIALVAGAGWAVLSSHGSAAPRDTGSANPAPPSSSGSGADPTSAPRTTPTTSATRSTTGSSTSATHHSSSPTPSRASLSSTSSASASLAPPPAVTTASSGPLLPGTYHRFRNAGTGDCLAQPSGSGTAGHQGCASDRAQGWEYTVPLTGVLGALTGQFELVNGSTGQCLTGGAGGPVSVRACAGSTTQFWSKTGGAGGATEFQNAADGQCLKTASGTVSEGPCASGDTAAQWAENGTV
jgi:hypothetical protein